MTGIEHWLRLSNYLERIELGKLISSAGMVESRWHDSPLHSRCPDTYRRFIHIHGYPSVYMESEISLAFLPLELAEKYTAELNLDRGFVFAVVDPTHSIKLAFLADGRGYTVHTFDSNEYLGKSGTFDEWMGQQVAFWLRILAKSSLSAIHTIHQQPEPDPLNVLGASAQISQQLPGDATP